MSMTNRLALGRALHRVACGAGVLLLAACGSGGEAPADDGNSAALSVSRPGELVSYVQDRLRQRQTKGQGQPVFNFGGALPTMADSAATAGAPPARSTTTLQEEGVDEADLLQGHGDHFYALQSPGDGTLRLKITARGSEGGLTPLKTLTLTAPEASSIHSDGMHLSADGRTLAVISQTWEQLMPQPRCTLDACIALPYVQWLRSSVQVQRVDASTPAAASAGDRIAIDGHLVDSRRIGDALVLVTRHTPQLALDALPAGSTEADREAAIARLTAAELLPQKRRNGASPEPLLAETDCYVQKDNASLGVEFTTITVFDLKSPTLASSSRCFAGGSEAMYMSPTALYLATTRHWYTPLADAMLVYPGEIRTDIHKFVLAADGVSYRGSADVAGHLGWDTQRKPYRMSEHNGDLRVLTYTGTVGWFTLDGAAGKPASPAQLTVLREASGQTALQTVATLPNASRSAALGKPGEQVYAVRFLGDRGYLVTFRRTDPLYVLDLSNPADPKAVGELEVSGYADYLYPLPGGLLLGMGREADANGIVTGLQASLFDVNDPARPTQLARVSFGGPFSMTALDSSRHGLNMLVDGGKARIALPANLAPPGPWDYSAPWTHGLQRFEVDLAARSLAALPMLGSSTTPYGGGHDLASERSLQVGDHVYFLSGGELTAYAW